MTEEQGGVDRSQVMLVILIVLAFIASIVMLFTDSDGALKIALLAALWAAIIGFFLVFRYRRDAEAARQELALSTELARAEAREEVREEVRALEKPEPSRDTAVLEDIQRELAGIRAQLENLAGRSFEYQPAAVRAHAHRIQELESTFAPEESDVPEPEPSFGAPSADAVAGRLGQQPSRPQSNPLADLIREKQQATEPRPFNTGAFQTVSWQPEREAEPEPEVEPEPEPVVEKPEPETEPEPESRGRRRRDENTSGLTVAELLARANKDA
ncbi:MAG: hypothetical protein Q4G50_07540 [Corynebacterium sp.]|uniref:DUF6779 domain-containing protein n=1 Tax=Corynebacterium sp. TaxID=1720 RepID=UPI0026E00D9B|nr:DUF6779 domain-containing protein [Corynebacterium sp.]MDO5669841.1 hypothetical protein [Corynebacterium sp.]